MLHCGYDEFIKLQFDQKPVWFSAHVVLLKTAADFIRHISRTLALNRNLKGLSGFKKLMDYPRDWSSNQY